jgi:hypothetical protein
MVSVLYKVTPRVVVMEIANLFTLDVHDCRYIAFTDASVASSTLGTIFFSVVAKIANARF